ncbi:hypothetical protein C8F01DRAFT_1050515 [Mycena amicta]|nr:hypothetical protein C8F01DRAFT_1050515 [Mycena amicta]
MKFRTRNPYYLRISENHVLPLYLYLDERHVSWMSETVLQLVLADLQPKILPKLKAEADVHNSAPSTKKTAMATVDTHRGDTYQFCYFIRKTEQHSALIKTRYFSAPPPQKKPNLPLQGSKRKSLRPNTQVAPNKRRKTKGKGKASDESDSAVSSGAEDAEPTENDSSDIEMAGSLSSYSQTHSVQDPVPVKEERFSQTPGPPSGAGSEATPIDLDQDDEEEKPKPVLSLQYRDFSIYGQCLCVVVEPYPPLRSASVAPSRAPSVAPVFSSTAAAQRQQSVPVSGGSAQRARTPLFLPDEDDAREGSVMPTENNPRMLPPVPLFNQEASDEEDGGGMMAFSQVMTSYSHLPAGMIEDDDELDGAVFFGDADEVKELYD